MSTVLRETCREVKWINTSKKVRQVGYWQELYPDARSTKHKITQVTCQHHAPAALRLRKNPSTHWTGGSRATTVEQCGLSRLYFSVLGTHNNGSRDVTLRNSCGFGSWPRDPTEPYRKATTTAGPHHPVTKRYSDSLPHKFHENGMTKVWNQLNQQDSQQT